MGNHIDGLKFAGGSFTLFQERALRELIDLAHEHGVYISTGGWAEHLLAHPDPNTVFDRYLQKCKDLGFDVIELSSGFISLPEEDWLRLVDKVHSYKLEAKPELGIQFGAGGDTPTSGLQVIGTSDPGKLVNLGHRFLKAGVKRLMIESEGITENVSSWRTDVVSKIMKELPSEQVMFEAADPKVFNWYIREFGIDVNLFVDHSQIVQLMCLRSVEMLGIEWDALSQFVESGESTGSPHFVRSPGGYFPNACKAATGGTVVFSLISPIPLSVRASMILPHTRPPSDPRNPEKLRRCGRHASSQYGSWGSAPMSPGLR
ncbi:Aldolase-type TIM barrel [Penicillium macrosclerotiorum]|uniref:Aldolase-type TIM barrel n=1 Tax=Penicillium macrosclerotiorum TaxID=303699 RepID=UPI00254877F4|nr:Aldolase-type TIM barrel [Penicillium macrosclerotiorum]KAJ5664739.1 Aldolase-type TIM barrel [Penicillium macrosclerotiorum]